MTLQQNKGFTLVELMVVVAIVAILAAVAFPAYSSHIRKGHRADAQAFMMDLGSRQQEYLINGRTYTNSISGLGVSTIPTEVSKYYTVTIPTATTTAFSIKAVASGSQANDTCDTLLLDQTGAKTGTKGGSAVSGCW